MCNIVAKSVQMSFFVLLSLCLYPTLSEAALAVQSEIISGIIIQKHENHSIELDNGEVYQPSRQNLIVNLGVGAPVTLRYVIEDDGKNVFFEFAPGSDSLQSQLPATPGSANTPQ